MQTSHAPAGTLDANFEFFEENGEVYFMNNRRTHEFHELDVVQLDMLREDLEAHPMALKAI